MKTLAILAAFALSLVYALAQTTNVVTGDVPALPADKDAYWTLAISAVTPFIVWLAAKIVPAMPRAFLPVIAPAIGIGLGFLLNWVAGQNFPWYASGAAGLAAVGFREIFNQQVTKRIEDSQNAPESK